MDIVTHSRLLVLTISLHFVGISSFALELETLAHAEIYQSKIIQKEAFETRTQVKFKYPDFEHVGQMRISQIFFLKINQVLKLGLHPSYTRERNALNNEWRVKQKIGFEANYSTYVEKVGIKFTGRYELREQFDNGNTPDQVKLKAVATFPVEGLLGLESISVSNESSYYPNNSGWVSNKFIPLMANFRVKDTIISPWVMYHRKRYDSSSAWREGYVVGINGQLRF